MAAVSGSGYGNISADVAYSTDAGHTWTTIQEWTSTEGIDSIPAVFDLDVSSQLAGESQVNIRWRYVAPDDWYWAIDDIEITGISSGNPVANTGIAESITPDLATLNAIINANNNAITDI